jgi:DNA-binding NtrC family response regulator
MSIKGSEPVGDRQFTEMAPPAEERCKVLVVDDDSRFLHSMEAVLSEHVTVVACTSAEQALRMLSTSTFHVVCSDFGMPGINGTDFLERVSALPYFVSTLLITGSEKYIRSSQPTNQHYVLLKPFEPTRLVGLVLQLATVARMKRGAQPPRESSASLGGDPAAAPISASKGRDQATDSGSSQWRKR